MSSAAEQQFHALFESAPVYWKGPTVMSWKSEITTAVTDDDWAGNGMRFATEQEALLYVADLAQRWTSVRSTRAVECTDPVNYRFVEGRVRTLPPADKIVETQGAPVKVTVKDMYNLAARELLQDISKELSTSAARAYGEPATVRMAASRLRDYIQALGDVVDYLARLDNAAGEYVGEIDEPLYEH